MSDSWKNLSNKQLRDKVREHIMHRRNPELRDRVKKRLTNFISGPRLRDRIGSQLQQGGSNVPEMGDGESEVPPHVTPNPMPGRPGRTIRVRHAEDHGAGSEILWAKDLWGYWRKPDFISIWE